MAKAATIIIDTHGQQFGWVPNKSCAGKGLLRPEESLDNPPSASQAQAQYNCQGQLEPMLQVEWFKNAAAKERAYTSYVKSGFDPRWISDAFKADTLMPPSDPNDEVNSATGTALRSAITITASGIKNFFGRIHVDFVDTIACHSLAVAPAFNARVYFGYKNIACPHQSIVDARTLFDRLFGKDGVDARTTSAAFAAGGFDPDFQMDAADAPAVFTPAVTEVTPPDESSVEPGSTTPVHVTFDAVMDQQAPRRVVRVDGCGASIENPRWTSPSTMSFDLAIAKASQGNQAILRITSNTARAGGSGAPAPLDGNQQPQGSSGAVPGGDDYLWKLRCGGQASATYTGSLDEGHTFYDGPTLGTETYHLTMNWTITIGGTRTAFQDGTVQPKITALTGTVTSSYDGPDGFSCEGHLSPAPVTGNSPLLILYLPRLQRPDGSRYANLDVGFPRDPDPTAYVVEGELPSAVSDASGPTSAHCVTDYINSAGGHAVPPRTDPQYTNWASVAYPSAAFPPKGAPTLPPPQGQWMGSPAGFEQHSTVTANITCTCSH
jgi:hypothetical protein